MAVERVLSSPETAQTTLIANAGVGRLADVVTTMTLVAEGLTALIFLLPLSLRWRWLRDTNLIFFMLTAYTLIPVAPFATQLAYLGYAVTNSKRIRAAYITLFFVYQLSDLILGSAWGPA